MSEPHQFSRPIENLIASLRGLPNDNARSRRRQEQPLGDAIDKLLQKYKVGLDAPEHTIRQSWESVVGSANAAYSHPLKIDSKHRLIVMVSHAVVRDELRILEPVVLERIRQLRGCSKVAGLVLRAG